MRDGSRDVEVTMLPVTCWRSRRWWADYHRRQSPTACQCELV